MAARVRPAGASPGAAERVGIGYATAKISGNSPERRYSSGV
jgi:hypothetical protein